MHVTVLEQTEQKYAARHECFVVVGVVLLLSCFVCLLAFSDIRLDVDWFRLRWLRCVSLTRWKGLGFESWQEQRENKINIKI